MSACLRADLGNRNRGHPPDDDQIEQRIGFSFFAEFLGFSHIGCHRPLLLSVVRWVHKLGASNISPREKGEVPGMISCFSAIYPLLWSIGDRRKRRDSTLVNLTMSWGTSSYGRDIVPQLERLPQGYGQDVLIPSREWRALSSKGLH